jgi:hypothetical protein
VKTTGGSHPRKGVSTPGQVQLLTYALTDGQWQRLRAHIPDQLEPAVETKLRTDIGLCCKHFLDHCRTLRDGGVTAEALKSPGKGALSAFEKLAKGLRLAADAWFTIGGDNEPNLAAWLDQLRKEPRLIEIGPWEDHDFQWPFAIGMSPEDAINFAIEFDACGDDEAQQQLCKRAAEQASFDQYKQRNSGKFFDDRLGPLSDLGAKLESLARDAERRLRSFQDLGEPLMMTARPQLVRSVKKRLQDAGLRPPVTNRVYASSDNKAKSGTGNPTWFQKFMAELNNSVLGIDGWGPLRSGDLPAFYSEITRALR